MADQPISVDGLRRRVSAVRDGAVERVEMSAHERGQLAGARNVLDYVLAELDRVRCDCPEPDDEGDEGRPDLRLILGDE